MDRPLPYAGAPLTEFQAYRAERVTPAPNAATTPPYPPIPRDLFKIRPAPKRKPPPEVEEILRVTRRGALAVVGRILDAVGRETGFTPAEIVSPRRDGELAKARHISVYLAKRAVPRSYYEIGKLFGRRDHTTIINSVRRAEEMIAANPDLAARIEAIERQVMDDT